MDKQLFCSLECATIDGVTDCHSVTLIHVANMMVIIYHNLQLYGFSFLTGEITFHIFANMQMSPLSHHSIIVKSALVLMQISPF